ncbi:MAG: glycosyltransferase [Acidimicrobiales bacterium]|nr:glycosyltransferase [Acidimicrobiales bacterium]
MKVLAVCEAPPTVDERAGDGSTLISREVLSRLPDDVELDLLYFADRDVAADPAVRDRCGRIGVLELRPALAAALSLPLHRHPRASWRREGGGARRVVEAWSAGVDVTYLHGLHAFGVASASQAPLVVNEVDPWSVYWDERARRRGMAGAAYDRLQAGRARRLERTTAVLASGYVVVNATDGATLAALLGRPIDVIPNGITNAPELPAPVVLEARTPVVAFVGTLDYAPNVDAARRLAREILPELRRRVPGARLVLAGRRPTAEVCRLAGDGVEVRADVPSVAEVFGQAAVAAYPTVLGRGTKNSVLEALASGCPVVATPAAASGVEPGPHLSVVVTPEAMVARLAELLTDEAARQGAARSARSAVATRPGWDDVAVRYTEVLRRAVSGPARSLQR